MQVSWLRRLALLAGSMLVLSPAPAQMEVPELSHTLTRLAQPVAAPDFVIEDMDGEPHSLQDYRGKVVLINFWATWCPPCRREMPSLESLYQKFRDQPFAVLAVNQWESPDHVFSYMGDLSVFPTFPILFDRKSEVSEAFGVKGLPTSVVIDKQGRVVLRAIGGRDFAHPEIERTIRELVE
jgi:thiol-disulfide isomerase/thioredoxin